MKHTKLKTLLLTMLMAVGVQTGWAESYTLTICGNGGNYAFNNNTQATSPNPYVCTVTIGTADYCDVSWLNPTFPYKTLQGYYTADGTQVYDASGHCIKGGDYWDVNGNWKYNGNVQLYAKWNGDHVLYFNPAGGTVTASGCFGSGAYKNGVNNDGIGYVAVSEGTGNFCDMSSCIPQREGYVFKGWYDAQTGGTQVYGADGKCIQGTSYWSTNNAYLMTSDATLYAQWTENVTIGGTVVTDYSDVTLTDGKDLVINKETAVSKITYTRSMTNNWGTICLPFAVSSEAGKVQYYKLAKVANKVMSFVAVDNVAANTPAVFQRISGDLSVSATDVTLNATINEGSSESTASDWKLVGTFAKTSISHENGNLYYIAQDKFWKATQAAADIEIPAYRAYFQFTGSGAKASSFTLQVSDGDNITAIGTIDAEGNVDFNTEGKYIENGNVVIVKNGKKYNAAGQNIK